MRKLLIFLALCGISRGAPLKGTPLEVAGNGFIGADFTLGTAGVKLSHDSDGAITFLGLGNGNDEDFTLNLDDTANTISLSSSTGVTTFDFGSIAITTSTSITATDGIVGSLEFEGTTADDFETTFTVTDPTADRTWTFGNVSATLTATTGSTITFQGTDTYIGRATTDTLTNKTLTNAVLETKVQLPTVAGSSTLSTGGDLAVNTTDKLIGLQDGSREVAIPITQYKSWSFDPKILCDGAVDRLFLISTDGSHAPKGIKIVKWKLSFEADPTTELDIDLKTADAFIGVTNSAGLDILDTTNGFSSESTASSINGGNPIATGKVIYLEFGTAYSETTHQCIFEMWWEVEED